MQEDQTLNNVFSLITAITDYNQKEMYIPFGNFLIKILRNGGSNTFNLKFYNSEEKNVFAIEFLNINLININEIDHDGENKYIVIEPKDKDAFGKNAIIYRKDEKLKIIKNVENFQFVSQNWIAIKTKNVENKIILFNVETEKYVILDEDSYIYKTLPCNNFAIVFDKKCLKIYDKNGKNVQEIEVDTGEKVTNIYNKSIVEIVGKSNKYWIIDKFEKIIEIPNNEYRKILMPFYCRFNYAFAENINVANYITLTKERSKEGVKLCLNIENPQCEIINKKNIFIDGLIDVYNEFKYGSHSVKTRDNPQKLIKSNKFLNFLGKNVSGVTYADGSAVLAVNHVGIFNKNGDLLHKLNKWSIAFPVVNKKYVVIIEPEFAKKLVQDVLDFKEQNYILTTLKFNLFLYDIDRNKKVKIGTVEKTFNNNAQIKNFEELYPIIMPKTNYNIYDLYLYSFISLRIDGEVKINKEFKQSLDYKDFLNMIKIAPNIAFSFPKKETSINLLGEDDFRELQDLLIKNNLLIERYSFLYSKKYGKELLLDLKSNNTNFDLKSFLKDKKNILQILDIIKKYGFDLVFISFSDNERTHGFIYCDFKKEKYYPILLNISNKYQITEMNIINKYLSITTKSIFTYDFNSLPLVNIDTFKVFQPNDTKCANEIIDVNMESMLKKRHTFLER